MIILPRGYLSHGQFHLWNSSKESYRKRYYLESKSLRSPQIHFGKKIARMLEDKEDHPILNKVPQYKIPEHRIMVQYKGIWLLGFLDTFEPCKFREYKTGHASPKGKDPWDAIKVRKHTQLPFYSVLVELEQGRVNNTCYLDWMETKKIKKTEDFDGIIVESQKGFDLVLTGRIETFKRVIDQEERDLMRGRIITTALEISKDYKEFINEAF